MLALPSEGTPKSRFKHLAQRLGKSTSIVLQSVSSPAPKPIIQRDDGLWSIGWADDADGPFESRRFAEAVAAQEPRRARPAVSS